ncbi:MAG TPA: Rv2993c-like domain-containing protein, partial [Burkholderiales bacterium]|nr:Rv2993c-like domain-containing protein [Burkholderiales bacterium]
MRWLRFSRKQTICFGFIEGDTVHACRGEMFGAYEPTGELIALADIHWETPCVPTKMIALWNNFHAAAAKFSLDIPAEPLFFIKGANSFCAHGTEVPAPKS